MNYFLYATLITSSTLQPTCFCYCKFDVTFLACAVSTRLFVKLLKSIWECWNLRLISFTWKIFLHTKLTPSHSTRFSIGLYNYWLSVVWSLFTMLCTSNSFMQHWMALNGNFHVLILAYYKTGTSLETPLGMHSRIFRISEIFVELLPGLIPRSLQDFLFEISEGKSHKNMWKYSGILQRSSWSNY